MVPVAHTKWCVQVVDHVVFTSRGTFQQDAFTQGKAILRGAWKTQLTHVRQALGGYAIPWARRDAVHRAVPGFADCLCGFAKLRSNVRDQRKAPRVHLMYYDRSAVGDIEHFSNTLVQFGNYVVPLFAFGSRA